MNKYILASRPKTLIAAIMPLLISGSFFHSNFQWEQTKIFLLILMLLASIGIQIATNFYNDAYDDINGFDDNRVGPKRMSVSNELDGKQLIKAAHLIIGVSALLSIPLAIQGGFYFAIIGLICLYLAYGYSAGILPLAQNGLGEFFTFIFFGLFAINGSFYILTKSFATDLFYTSIQYSFFITLIIMMNNIRDIKTDKESNKRTLATKIGKRKYEFLICSFTIIPFLLCFVLNRYSLLLALPLYLYLIFLIKKNDVRKAFLISCLGLVLITTLLIKDFF